MKNYIKTSLSAFLVALVFFFAGCQDGSDTALPPQKGASAKIVVSVEGAGGGARTVGPDATDVSYRLVVTNNYDETEKYEADITGSTVTRELKAGSWKVGVWAYTGESLGVGWAQKTVALAEGETKNVSLVVQPLTTEEAAGTFSWEITRPEGDENSWTWAQGTLTPASPNSITSGAIPLNDFSEYKSNEYGYIYVSGSLELPSGKYTLDAVAASNRQINGSSLKAVRKEIVYIYPRLVTNASFTFTAADFSAEVYFSGTATLSYPTGAPAYTPTEVELRLADGSVKSEPITGDAWGYAWELSALSNAINTDNLANALFRFKAEAAGGKSLYSSWQNIPLSDVTGRTNIQLVANVYKVTVPQHTGGSVEVNPEAVGGGSTRLTLKPAPNYGFDATSLPSSATPVDGSNGLQYDFIMPNFDTTVYVNFFQLTGTVVLTGDNTDSQYKPIKVEAIEEGAGYAWFPIAETANFGASTDDYPWTIDANGYVYTNDGSTTSWNKNIIFKVTLESGDKSISYAYIVKKSVSSLYGKGTAVVNVPINTLSNVYAETVSDTSITLRWDQAAWATGGYNVYRSSDGANYAKVNASPIPLTAAADAPAVTYEDTGLSPAHTYYYYVKGILAGDAEGEATYLGSIQTKYETPTGVTASFSGGYPLRNYVSWSAVPYGQNSYTRYYNVYRNGEYITNTSSTYYYDNVQFDSTYTYTVVAWGSDGENSAESASSATILTPQISDISRNSFTENYISTGEYQYFRVYTAQNYSYNYFNLSSTNAEIYVQAGSDYNFPSNSTTYYSGAGGSPLYIYNSYYPVIVVVRGDSDGSYSFSVD